MPGTPRFKCGSLASSARPVVVREGWEANAGIGSGFADTYGLGFEGRVGFTFLRGAYLGGAVQYFIGHSVNDQNAHATFVGGEAGERTAIAPDLRDHLIDSFRNADIAAESADFRASDVAQPLCRFLRHIRATAADVNSGAQLCVRLGHHFA